MKRQKRQTGAKKFQRRRMRCELLEPRLPLAVDTWEIDLSAVGNVNLFGPNAGGDVQQMYEDNQGSEGNVISTSNVPGQNNQPPVAVDDAVSTDQDTVLNGDVLVANPTTPDSDPDADPLSVTMVQGSAGNVGATTALASGATVNVAAVGTFAYDPNGAFDFLAATAMATDTFSYTIEDPLGAADSAVVTVTITGLNDAPNATNLTQSQTYIEDVASVALDDIVVTEPDVGDTITATMTLTDTSTGSLTASSGNGETYTPGTGIWTVAGSVTAVNAALAAAAFVPAANNVATSTITTHVEDAAVAGPTDGTITLSVTAVNDEPSFTKGTDETVLEDAGAQTVNGWATALSKGPADEAGQTLSFNITGNSNPGLFAVAPAVNASGDLTYTPAIDANGSAVITLNIMDNGGTLNGGDDTSPDQTVTINVTAVNDEPSFTKGADETVLEDAGGQTVNGWATALSKGPADEAGQALSFNITGNSNPGLFSAAPAVNSSGDFTYTPAADANGSAVVTLNIMDDGGTLNGGDDTSSDQTVTINVTAVNDEPSFTKGADETVLEDAGAQTVNGWATALSKGPADEVGQTLSFNITGNSNPGLFSSAPAVNASGDLTYTPTADANGSAVITLNIMDNGGTLNEGDDTSPDQTFTINVTAVNDAPALTLDMDNSSGNAPNFTATFNMGMGAPVSITDTDVDITDIDDTMLSSATVTISNVQDGADEVLAAIPSGAIMAGDISFVAGVLTITKVASLADYEAVLASVTYDNIAASPTAAPPRIVNFVVNDGTDNSAVVTSTVTVFNGPQLDLDLDNSTDMGNDFSTSFIEDLGAKAIVDSDVSITSAINIISATIILTNRPDGVAELLSVNGALPGAIVITDAYDNADGQLVISGNDTVANYLIALQQIEFNNTSQAPDTTDRIVTIVIRDTNTDDSTPATATLSITGINDPPNDANESYDVQSNVGIQVNAANGLVMGATDPEGNVPIVLAAGSVGTFATTAGGSITTAADGSFTYTPQAGDVSIADTFVYSAEDSLGLSSPSTATFNIDSNTIWFIDNTSGNDATGDGTLSAPFKTLSPLDDSGANADTSNQTIFIYNQAAHVLSTDFDLENGQHLIGEGVQSSPGDTINDFRGFTTQTNSLTLPAVHQATNPVIATTGSEAITLGSGNTIRGIDIAATIGAGIRGTTFGTLTIDDVSITSIGRLLNLTTGTISDPNGGTTFENLTQTLNYGTAITLNGVGGSFQVGTATTIIGGIMGIDIDSTPAGANFNFGATTISGGTDIGIEIDSSPGATFTFDSLDVTVDDGTGFKASNGGTINIGGTGNMITSTNGAAIDIVVATFGGGGVTFANVTSVGGSPGINLFGTTGSVTFTSVDIDNSTLVGIVLNDADTVSINGGTIDGTGNDGISAQDTDLTISGLTLGATTQIGDDAIEYNNQSGTHTLAINNNTVSDTRRLGIKVKGILGGTIIVTSLSGNVVAMAGSADPVGGMAFDTVTFDSDPVMVGIQPVMGGNTLIGNIGLTTNINGDGLRLDYVLGHLVFNTLNIGNDNGTGLFIRDAAGKGGTFAFGNSGGSINTTNGAAMDIDPVAMSTSFSSVSSTNANGQGSGGSSGINLDTISGSVFIAAGSITGATGPSFRLNGGTAGVVYSGGITHTAASQPAVAIIGGHNTGIVTFQTGSIVDTNGTGLQFDNADGTYNFNGTTTLNGGDAGIDILNGSAGTFTFTNTTITNPSGVGLNIDSSTGNVNYNGGSITQNNAVSAVVINSQSAGTIDINVAVTANTGTATGINLTSNAGGTINFDGGLDIDTTTGTGLFASGGTITSTVGTIDTGTGIGIDIDNAALGLSLDSVSVSGAANGINLDTTTGSFTVSGGTITNASGAGIEINAHSGGFTYAGTLTNNSGRSVEVTNSGGTPANTILFSGSIDDDGTGIFLDNNDQNSGATINFTGGLALDTGANTAFTATNGGTVNTTGTNRIGATTALSTTAINVANTTIGASNLNFETVNVTGGGAGTGIVLNNTGTSGGLKMGAGGTNPDDGGVLQNLTNAMLLTLTSDVVLNRVRFQDISGDGVRGDRITDGGDAGDGSFQVTNSVFRDIGTVAGSDDVFDFFSSNDMNGTFNISGDVTFTSNIFDEDSAGADNAWAGTAIHIQNQSAVTMNLLVDETTFANTSTTADDAVGVLGGFGSTHSVNVEDSAATDIRGMLLFVTTEEIGTTANVDFVRNEVRRTVVASIGGGITLNSTNQSRITFDIQDNCPTTQVGCTSGDTTAGFYNLFLDPITVANNGTLGQTTVTSNEGRINKNRIEDATARSIVLFNDGDGAPMASTVLVDNNTVLGGGNAIDLVWRESPDVTVPTAAADRTWNLTISNNTLGTVGSPLGDDGIDGLDLNKDSVMVPDPNGIIVILVDNNSIRTTSGSAVRIDIEESGTGDITIKNNSLLQTTGGCCTLHALEIQADDTTSINASIFGNTLSSLGSLNIELNRVAAASTLNIEQSMAQVSSLNSVASLNESGMAVTYSSGVTPTTPTLPSNPLEAAAGVSEQGTSATPLTVPQLESIVDEAVARWTATGLSEFERSLLKRTMFTIADLSVGEIGLSAGTEITIDINAAGHGWFIDATPGDDVEFATTMATTERVASQTSDAFGRMDLLTVVLHEIGHILGKEHADAPNLMAEDLSTGMRRLPATNNAADVDRDGKITSRDVLRLVNVINAYGSLSSVASAALGLPFAQLDINRDGIVSLTDVRLVVNAINKAGAARALQSKVIANAAAGARTNVDANSANHLARTQHFAALAEMATHGPLPMPSRMASHVTADDKELLTVGLEDDLLTMLADDWHRGT